MLSSCGLTIASKKLIITTPPVATSRRLALRPYHQVASTSCHSYQYTGSFVTGFGSSPIDDEFVNDRGTIDLQLSYGFLDQYTVTFGVQNATNEPLRVYQGDPDRVTNLDVSGIQFWFGVRAQM